MKIASREASLQYFNECDLANRVGHMCMCVAGPPWHGDLPSAVLPAGKTACICVSWLLPDTATCRVGSGRQGRPPVYVCHSSSLTQRPAEWGLAGREDRLCMCVAAPPWHGDLPSAVWLAGKTAGVCVSRLLPDMATCRMQSGRQGRPLVYVCRSSFLTRRPAECGLARPVCFANLLCFLLLYLYFTAAVHFWNEDKKWLSKERAKKYRAERRVRNNRNITLQTLHLGMAHMPSLHGESADSLMHNFSNHWM